MHTKDILAEALLEADLGNMAAKAREGYYHDFLSPLETPTMQLMADLAKAGTAAAMAVRRRAMTGEFDATKEEGEDWAASPEGQETLGRLKSGR
jgi:hypothetical protein